MHSDIANRTIQRMTDKVIDTIRDGQKKIDLVLYDYKKKISELSSQYKPEFIEELTGTYQDTARMQIEDIRDDCKTAFNHAFGEIRAAVQSWVAEPIPGAVAGLLDDIRKNNLQLSNNELIALSEQCGSSYFAMRVLEQIASKQKVMFPHFESLDELNKMLTTVESLSRDAIANYAGQEPEVWLSGPGVEISKAVMAATFLHRESNSLQETRDRLLTLTSEGLALIPSEKKRITELFKDCEDEDAKIDRMLLLLEDSHTNKEDESVLKMFNPNLYKAALTRQRDTARIAAKSAFDVAQKKKLESMEASTKFKEASAKLEDAK